MLRCNNLNDSDVGLGFVAIDTAALVSQKRHVRAALEQVSILALKSELHLSALRGPAANANGIVR